MKATWLRLLRVVILGALVLCGTSAHAQSAAETAPVKLKLMTFNIHHGAPAQGAYDLDATIGVMQLANADLIAVQEVDQGYSDRSNNEDQPQRLREALDAHVAYHPNIGETYGNALVTTTAVKAHKNHSLPNPEDDEPRGLLHALYEVDGQTFHVLVTHLSAYSHSENRKAQTAFLVEKLRQLEKPVILMGDFNSTASTELGPLFEDGTLVSSRAKLGLPEAIDDIIVSRSLAEGILTGGEIDTDVSDHLPYWITLQIDATPVNP